MRKVFLVLALALAGCSHGGSGGTPAAKDPNAVPPLPPSSGTPIGILLDEQTRLHLRDDQVAKLRELDQGLAARNEKLDSDVRSSAGPQHDPTTMSNPAMGGGRHGGRHGGGRHGGGAGPANHPPQGPDSAVAAKADSERVANVKDALEKAFAILDEAQRPEAQKLLGEHGVDLAGAKAGGDGDGAAPSAAPAGGDGDGDGP